MKQNVIARFSVKSDKLETFFEFAKVLIEKTRAEKGCELYRFYQGILGEETEIIVYEIYSNEQSVMEHKQSVHLAEFLQKIENLLQKPPIVELHTIN